MTTLIHAPAMKRLRRMLLSATLVATFLFPARLGADPFWAGYAENAQHTALSSVASQALGTVRWSTPVDDVLQHTTGTLLVHYGSPIITTANTVIVPVRGANNAFRLEAHRGS